MQKKQCINCKQWNLKDKDNYCGYCGNLVIDIQVEPKEIVLTSSIINKKSITFKNTGFNDSYISFQFKNSIPDFLDFDKSSNILIKKNSSTNIEMSLKEDEIPANFSENIYNLDCLINGDKRKVIRLKIKIKTGPMPYFSSNVLNFYEIDKHNDEEQTIELANHGSISLKLDDIKFKGCPHLKIKNKKNFTNKLLKRGYIEKIPIIWDSKLFNESDIDFKKMEMIFIFKNFKNIRMPIKALIKKIELSTNKNKNKIKINEALEGKKYYREIIIKNTGNTDIEIKEIKANENWVKILNNPFALTMISSKSKKVKSKSVLNSYTLKLEIDTQKIDIDNQDDSDVDSIKKETTIDVITTDNECRLKIEIVALIIPLQDLDEYIGIDFGTTNSVISIYNSKAKKIELIEISTPTGDKKLIPSILVFDEDDINSYKIGYEALSESITKPELTVRSIKRIMGHKRIRKFNKKNFSPSELAACIIKKLVELASNEYYKKIKKNYNIKKAIITVPANFFHLQIEGILDACKASGIDIEEDKKKIIETKGKEKIGKDVKWGITLDEPSAAALYYMAEINNGIKPEVKNRLDKGEKLHFLIFDYGGGTLDVSVIQVENFKKKGIGIYVLANKGNNKIGGDSIDLKIMNQLLLACKSEYPKFDEELISCTFKELSQRYDREDWSDDIFAHILRARAIWKEASEKAKIELSKENNIKLDVPDEFIFFINNEKVQKLGFYRTTLNRNTFEGWIAKILSDCENVVRDAINLAGITEKSIAYIIHTGRSSLIPVVKDRVKSIFPHLSENENMLDEKHLKICVAKGAVMYGLARNRYGSNVFLVSEGRKLPHSYGIDKFDPFTSKFIYDEIIKIGTSYPTKKDEPIKKHIDEDNISGNELHLTFYQNSGTGISLENNSDINKIGEIFSSDVQSGCDLTFEIDKDRKLTVTVDNKKVKIRPPQLDEDEEWM